MAKENPNRLAVLIVDDEPSNINMLTQLLRRMDNKVQIYAAPNGKIALELALKFKPTVILSDWEMPVMNGLELVKALKAEPEIAEIPVIMITAVMTAADSMKAAFEAGVHDFLRKPFEPLELFARLRNTLRLSTTMKDLQKVNDLLNLESKFLQKANERIFRSNHELNQFAFIVTHHLKAPLRQLDAIANFIAEDLEDEKYEELHKHADRLGQRVQRLELHVEGILGYSRAMIDEERLETVLLGPLVDEVIDNSDIPPGMKILIPNPLPQIMSNTVKMVQVFQHLISNAVIHHDQEVGNLTIRAKDEHEHWLFEVEDDGPGIPEKYRPEIMDLFKKIPKKDDNKNIGMGLAIVKKIVEQHGGKVWIKSDGKRGTTILFTLPKQGYP